MDSKFNPSLHFTVEHNWNKLVTNRTNQLFDLWDKFYKIKSNWTEIKWQINGNQQNYQIFKYGKYQIGNYSQCIMGHISNLPFHRSKQLYRRHNRCTVKGKFDFKRASLIAVWSLIAIRSFDDAIWRNILLASLSITFFLVHPPNSIIRFLFNVPILWDDAMGVTGWKGEESVGESAKCKVRGRERTVEQCNSAEWTKQSGKLGRENRERWA